jgi:hypothetical protein
MNATTPQSSDAFAIWQRRYRSSQSRLRVGVIRQRQREITTMASGRLVRLPSKSAITNARKAYKANARAKQPHAMLNMPAPAGHQHLPRFPDDRSRTLYAAHLKRRESGWTHG